MLFGVDVDRDFVLLAVAVVDVPFLPPLFVVALEGFVIVVEVVAGVAAVETVFVCDGAVEEEEELLAGFTTLLVSFFSWPFCV